MTDRRPGGWRVSGRLLKRLLAAAIITAAAVLALVWWLDRQYAAPGPLVAETTMIVPRGASVAAIADRLAAAGVIASAAVFQVGVRLEAAAGPLQAGEYAFAPAVSGREVARQLRAGRTVVHRLTIPEGLTSRQVVARIAAAEGLDGTVDAIPAEGTLLPDTYHYRLGDDRAVVLARMRAAMDRALAEAWDRRAAGLPLASPAETLILASIVEKETAQAAERPRVAAVYLNRLRRGMRLQADPTVVYAVAGDAPSFGRALSRADLATPSPFNTYLKSGLPPGPIANPGLAALAAVVAPAVSEDLYFVADGRGGHAFARTLSEHNANVARWRNSGGDRATEPAAPVRLTPGSETPGSR